MDKCKATNCNNKNIAKGWCWNHYYYFRKYGEEKSLSHIINQYNVNHKCKEPNCNELLRSQGYCPKHLYIRKRNSSKKYKSHKFRDNRSKNPLLSVWNNMLERCYNPKHKQYKDYGARGIKVCNEWKNDFWQFVKDMGERPQGTSIERINNNDIYKISNCKWANQNEQLKNRREITMIKFQMDSFLESNLLSIKDLFQKTKINMQILYYARKKGRIKPQNLKILIKYFPSAKNFITFK